MDRNTIIAIVLSVIVITVGMGIQTAFFTPEMAIPAEEAAIESAGDGVLPSASGADISPAGTDPDPSPFEVEAGSYIITFDPRGASVSSIKLSEHYDNGEPVELLFRDPDDENAFMLYAGGNQSDPIDAVFSHTETVSSEGIHIISFTRDFTSSDGSPFTITKQYAVPDNGEYMIQLAVTFSTPDGSPIPLNLDNEMYSISVGPQIGPAFESMSSNYDYRRVSVRYDDRNRSEARFSDGIFVSDEDETVDWISLAGKYFAFILMPDSDVPMASAIATNHADDEMAVPQENTIGFVRSAGGEGDVMDIYSFYAGPKVSGYLDIYNRMGENIFGLNESSLNKVVDGNWLSWLEAILKWILQLFYRLIPNYGVAIILLTVLIKAVFWPLTAKSYASMEQMRRLKPQMDEIRERCKDDKQAMNKEVMALYKTYGVNPASGCIPLLIQLPVFFGLYQALLTSIELRHASFITYLPGTDMLWLADLSSKDPYYITPIIMGVTMFIQQRFNPPASDPTQQKIMMALPFVFTILFLGFPSGLVIYWLVNNILSILQQWMMSRKQRLDK